MVASALLFFKKLSVSCNDSADTFSWCCTYAIARTASQTERQPDPIIIKIIIDG